MIHGYVKGTIDYVKGIFGFMPKVFIIIWKIIIKYHEAKLNSGIR